MSAPGVARIIIVSSRGPSAQRLPPGTILPDGARLRLKAGDMLSIIDNRGTRQVSGPADIVPDQEGARAQSQGLIALLSRSNERRARIAAVRSQNQPKPEADAPPEPPPVLDDSNIWLIDGEPGTWCVGDPEQLQIWRPAPLDGVQLTVTSLEGAGGGTTRWQKGQHIVVWPYAVPVQDGGQYAIRAGNNPEVIVKLRVFPAGTTSVEQLAQQLYDLECDAQLRKLASQQSKN